MPDEHFSLNGIGAAAGSSIPITNRNNRKIDLWQMRKGKKKKKIRFKKKRKEKDP